jgi:LPXTG-motif cell wall-anchored protein
MERFGRTRRSALGLLTLTAMSMLLFLSFGFGQAFAASVDPVLVTGNPTCADYTHGGTELKIEEGGELQTGDSGSYTDGTLVVDVKIYLTESGWGFDWLSNFGVDAVVAKGGPNANLYLYSPLSTGDSGLHAPLNQTSGTWYGLSHISFCYFEENATTTTTTSTTTLAPTSTESTTTPSSAPATSVTTIPAQVLPTQLTTSTTTSTTIPAEVLDLEVLPLTGSDIAWLALSGVSLLVLGVMFVLAARRVETI